MERPDHKQELESYFWGQRPSSAGSSMPATTSSSSFRYVYKYGSRTVGHGLRRGVADDQRREVTPRAANDRYVITDGPTWNEVRSVDQGRRPRAPESAQCHRGRQPKAV